MYPKRERANGIAIRIAVVALIFAVGTVLLVIRAYRLHVSDAESLQKRAQKQREKEFKLGGLRGMMFDRTGAKLAASLRVESVYAHPRLVRNTKKTAEILSQILEMPEDKIVDKLIVEDKSFVWIRRKVTPIMSKKVKAARLAGIGTNVEYRRFYPLKSLAAHAIGFASIDSDGLEGLELQYDRALKTEKIRVVARRDALGRLVDFPFTVESPKRRDLHLTLDRGIQYVTERGLEEALTKTKARSASAVVMNADTGEILALAIRPTYNLNVFNKVSADVRRNRVVTDTFEPGSTFKVFLAAAVLDLGRIKLSDQVNCHLGLYKYRGTEIHDIVPRRRLSFEKVVVYSSNIGAVKVSQRLKRNEFYRYVHAFGFGNPTGVDLPGERPGSLLPPGKWNAVTKANVAFGQGLAVNSLQLTAAFAAAVNGGLLHRPYLMKQITDSKGEVIRTTGPTLIRRVIRPDTSAKLVHILERAVIYGTGKAAAIPNVRVIGKTGTAQKADPHGGYSREKYVASFIGALLDIQPRVVIFVMIDEPQGRHKTGGKIAAPVFRKIAEGILARYGSIPGKPEPIPDTVVNRPEAPSRKPAKTVRIRKGRGPGEWVVPDLKGMTVRQVLDVCGRIKCDAAIEGSGLAVKQDPKPGKTLKEGGRLRVSFERHT